MRRRSCSHRRGVLAVLAVLVVLAIGAGPDGVAQAQLGGAGGSDGPGVVLSDVGARTLAGLESCLRTDQRVGVALVVDATLTLLRTDPDDVRADVLVQFVRRLRELTALRSGDVERELWLHVSFFGAGNEVVQDWVRVDPADLALEDRLREAIVARFDARFTRFERAVTPAGDALADLTLRLGSEGLCSFALWFSDGELDPDDRVSLGPDRPAMRAAIDELCRPDGVMDRFRAGPGALVGLLLNVDPGGLPASGVGMREVVEGRGPGGECGTLPADAVFLEGGLYELLRLVERVAVGAPDASPSGDPLRILVDPGVARVRLVGPASAGLRITSAAGRELDVVPGGRGTGALASASEVRWAGGTVSIDVEVDGDHGTWTVRRAGVSRAMDVYLFSDLTIEVDRDASVLLRGAPSEVVGAVRSLDGGGPELSRFGSVAVTVDVRGGDAARSAEVAADGTLRVPVRLDGPDARMDLTLTLRAVTVGGSTLQPVVLRTEFDVRLPEEFPSATLVDRRASPALVRAGDTATLTIALAGSAVGPTRVCPLLGPLTGDAGPAQEGAGAVALAVPGLPADGCLDLATGGSAELDVEATLLTPSLVVRELDAPITLRLVSAARDGAPPLELETRLDGRVPVDRAPPSVWVFWGLIAAGLLVPWLVLWILAGRAAALLPSRGLRVAHVDALLVPGDAGSAPRVARSGPGSPLDPGRPLLTGDDFGYASGLSDDVSVRARRSWKVSGGRVGDGPGPLGETVQVVRPGPLLRPPGARVTAPDGMRIVTAIGDRAAGTSPGRSADAFRDAPGLLTLDGVVHLLVADRDLRGPEDAPVPVRLTVLVAAEGRSLDTRIGALAHRAAGMVGPQVLAGLREVASTAGITPDQGGAATSGDAGPSSDPATRPAEPSPWPD